jgi:hypothetical protein
MKLRAVGLLVVLGLALAGCSSSSSSKGEATATTTASVDADVQAATACKAMETMLKNTAGGATPSGPDTQAVTKESGALLKTPEGKTPTTADTMPKWYELGTLQILLLQAAADQDTASVDAYTKQARTICATVPEAAQKEAGYSPVAAA